MGTLKIKEGNSWVPVQSGGVGVPSGGTTDQYLKKSSPTDYACEWADMPLPISGSNTNGRYVKFPDGTLIQWGSFTKTSGSTSDYSPIYILQLSFDFPISFIDTHYTITGSGKFGTGASLAFGQEGGTSSAGTIRVWDGAPRTLSSSMVLKVNWMAIGRWK